MDIEDQETTTTDLILEEVIKNRDLQDLTIEAAQLISEIPVIGIVVKSIRFTASIYEKIFESKIRDFLFELKDIPLESRQKKINEINESEKIQYSAGMLILDQLSRVDANHKPKMIGKLFASYISGDINLAEYLRLAHIISNAFYFDIKEFIDSSSDGLYRGDQSNSLINGELMIMNYVDIYKDAMGEELKDINGNPLVSSGKDKHLPEITQLGQLLLQVFK